MRLSLLVLALSAVTLVSAKATKSSYSSIHRFLERNSSDKQGTVYTFDTMPIVKGRGFKDQSQCESAMDKHKDIVKKFSESVQREVDDNRPKATGIAGFFGFKERAGVDVEKVVKELLRQAKKVRKGRGGRRVARMITRASRRNGRHTGCHSYSEHEGWYLYLWCRKSTVKSGTFTTKFTCETVIEVPRRPRHHD